MKVSVFVGVSVDQFIARGLVQSDYQMDRPMLDLARQAPDCGDLLDERP